MCTLHPPNAGWSQTLCLPSVEWTRAQRFESAVEGQSDDALRLSQIHGYAVQSGGSANIHSVLGKGTRFEPWTPRISKPANGWQHSRSAGERL